MKKGFTLIELLVVVLIIGILIAVALPKYQVAVKKATAAKYMDIVRAIRDAEEVYYLASDSYTFDLALLDIGIPVAGCTFFRKPDSGYYECPTNPTSRYGVWGKSQIPDNAQAGDTTIRYVMFLRDTVRDDINFKKGDIVCYSKGDIADQACRALGSGTQYPRTSETSWTHYILD